MSESQQLFAAAQQHIPGGVNSPVRAFKSVGGAPIFIQKAKGPNLFDVDGKSYTDYIGSWGPMILGHAHPEIINAVKEAADNGLSYGAPTAIETQMAEKICDIMPSMDMVRMVSSGTEATMSAIRLARGHTGRDVIIKFEGCYHGHVDSLLVKAGSGALTLGVPDSPGIPEDLAKYTLTLPFNDLPKIQETFAKVGSKIACIIVEPVAGNMNCIAPAEGFLEGLRSLCDEHGSLLIFDEVMTGFRVALGGAQEYYNIKPDLTCLGKIIGGGMPVGAFGGNKDVMSSIAPLGPVYQAGTLSGNPIAMTAGLKTLELISVDDFYESLTIKAKWLTQGMQQSADALGIPFTTEQVGGMFGLFFSLEEKVDSFKKATECRMDLFNAFFHSMLEQGVYLAPSAYEAGFISNAHTTEDIEKTLVAAENSFIKIQEMV